jgi:tRNA pseudouridine38-40 synthase
MGNFAAFSAARHDEEESSSLVLLERFEILQEGGLVLIGLEGSHFLWKMVRRIVGVLVAVGRGQIAADRAAGLAHESSDVPARLTAPASGLFLARVFYGGERRDVPFRAVTPLE